MKKTKQKQEATVNDVSRRQKSPSITVNEITSISKQILPYPVTEFWLFTSIKSVL